MSQQSAIVQTTTATTTVSEMTPVLGTLQSVGPNNQAPSVLSNVQSGTTTTAVQPQTQSQQTQYVPQTPKSVQQSSTPSSFSDFPQFLTKTRLQDLVREVDPTEQLDEEVEEMLLQLADDFVETTVNAACLLAKHRHANTVEVKDVQLHLGRNWNMWIPGFGTDEVRPYKRATVTEAHKQRLALIRKSIKKY
ncbi:PREDICTED: transcription initiation factor TFIID subunit 12 [Atta cephalotes]|uniref:Transcription initiation factor TFIID subunit 12 n=2 Tax=Atta TaxID=12956 RepID=A0A158NAK5_ATTCE|nr:PREDICTED: transcription initiation factor TFIID subunit 12 [Atta cephalotes]XP_018059008.1 PREDICTED: transcription initiation factor TFIID subunit 12 isoform X2 [Atta colombica]XP_018059009.1 PREDICTED: transcription initiation factor TFIID subunit 12 isoform X2 [Atta colombica]XP_018059010.1 PREDICTED: transcription initiation factor TFIID subunit 12 isoform X2 [Atta colombica]XP_018059011.1 PREDICTED: transcription initiation factor TFIID subunit 12 isoform X2 [Atta colombica]XP_0180590